VPILVKFGNILLGFSTCPETFFAFLKQFLLQFVIFRYFSFSSGNIPVKDYAQKYYNPNYNFLKFFYFLFKLAIEIASNVTYIKHNLIPEYPDLFNTGLRQVIKTLGGEILNEITVDDIII